MRGKKKNNAFRRGSPGVFHAEDVDEANRSSGLPAPREIDRTERWLRLRT